MLIAKIPDDALVVRGGKNRPEDIRRGSGTHPSGIAGVSVESSEGVSISELARMIPHGQVGVTTVGEIRKAGGECGANFWAKPLSCDLDWTYARTS